MRKQLGLLIGLALLCIAATNLPSLGLLEPGTNAPVGVKTNVPVHVLPVIQQAQDLLSQYIVLVIPVVVPLLIAGLKKFIPNVPTVFLPVLAPLLGVLADWIIQMSGVHTGGLIKGAFLGAAGVGLRELQNQVAKAMPQPPIANLPPKG